MLLLPRCKHNEFNCRWNSDDYPNFIQDMVDVPLQYAGENAPDSPFSISFLRAPHYILGKFGYLAPCSLVNYVLSPCLVRKTHRLYAISYDALQPIT